MSLQSTVLFICLPVLQEFSALENENGNIYKVPSETYPYLNATMEHGWNVTSTMIKACKDYQKCPWNNLETLPSQAFLEPDASLSEITRAKETYLTQYSLGSQNIDDCFTSLILSMWKESKNCKSIYSVYYTEFLNKFGFRKDIPQTESTSFVMDFTKKTRVTGDYLQQCVTYMSNHEESYTSLASLDATSKLAFKIVCCIISIFGLLGNLALFVIYVRKDRKVRFNFLMLMIATYDFFFIFFGVVKVIIELTVSSEDQPIFFKIVAFLYYFTFTGSVYTTTLVAIERYLILCKEKYVLKLCLIIFLYTFKKIYVKGKLINILSTGPFCSSLFLQLC